MSNSSRNVEALARAGWSYRAGEKRVLEVDCVEDDGFGVVRVLQAQGICERSGASLFRDEWSRVMAFFQIDGSGLVYPGERDSKGIALRPGEFFVTVDHPQLKYVSSGGSARVELSFAVASQHYITSSLHGVTADFALARVIVSVANEVLSRPAELDSSGMLHLRAAMWELLSGVREQLTDRERGVSPRIRELHRAAVKMVATSAPGAVTVDELCSHLHVSERYLRTVLRRYGDSPSRLIRRGNVNRVLLALRDATISRPLRDDAFARSLGYKDSGRLRRDVRGILDSPSARDAELQGALRSLPPALLTEAGYL